MKLLFLLSFFLFFFLFRPTIYANLYYQHCSSVHRCYKVEPIFKKQKLTLYITTLNSAMSRSVPKILWDSWKTETEYSIYFICVFILSFYNLNFFSSTEQQTTTNYGKKTGTKQRSINLFCYDLERNERHIHKTQVLNFIDWDHCQILVWNLKIYNQAFGLVFTRKKKFMNKISCPIYFFFSFGLG